jgi:hypothetical protein
MPFARMSPLFAVAGLRCILPTANCLEFRLIQSPCASRGGVLKPSVNCQLAVQTLPPIQQESIDGVDALMPPPLQLAAKANAELPARLSSRTALSCEPLVSTGLLIVGVTELPPAACGVTPPAPFRSRGTQFAKWPHRCGSTVGPLRARGAGEVTKTPPGLLHGVMRAGHEGMASFFFIIMP